MSDPTSAARPSPRRPCGSWQRSTPSATACEQRLFAGCFGIFGHGNVAGLGQALLQAELEDPDALPYVLGRNEQAMVHTAVAYARMRDRLQTYAVSTSVGPGRHQHGHRRRPGDHQPAAGAAPARRHLRRPQRLAPAAGARAAVRRRRHRQRRVPAGLEVLRPRLASRAAAGRAARRRCGCSPTRPRPAPSRSASRRTCRPRPTTGRSSCSPSGSGTSPGRCRRPARSRRPPTLIRSARRPLVVAGGGVGYAQANEALAAFCEATGIPVGQSQAGKGSLVFDHPQCLGAIGSTGTTAANAIAREADVVIGIGTRYSDFTTASRTAFQNPDVRFVNINVAPDRRRQARRRRRRRRRARDARVADQEPGRLPGPTGVRRGVHRLDAGVAGHRRRGVPPGAGGRTATAAHPGRGARPGQRPLRPARTSSCAPPGRCPATCTSCGRCATPRATTSSTATPAWATRWPAGSAYGWPARTATSSSWSATGPT